jgi:hypothetical protein
MWLAVLFPSPDRRSPFFSHKPAVRSTEDSRRRKPAQRLERIVSPLRIMVRALELGQIEHTGRTCRDSAHR